MNSFLGQITLFAGNFIPRYYAQCDGQLLPVSQYEALYSLIGNTYGGDNKNFALPDLRSRLPIGSGQGFVNPKDGAGAPLTLRPLASSGGHESVRLSDVHMPPHRHVINVLSVDAANNDPSDNYLATTPTGTAFYFTQQDGGKLPTKTVMGKGTLTPVGENMPHENRMPMLPLVYIMCVEGIYPPLQSKGPVSRPDKRGVSWMR